MSKFPFTKGLHKLSDSVYAYIQPDGSWGLNNAGLILGSTEAVVVDTLYDAAHTQLFINEIQKVLPRDCSLAYLINTHANGDHWYGNHLFENSQIIATHTCAKEMRELPPGKMAWLMRLHWLLGKGGKYARRAFKDFDYSKIPPRYPDILFKGQYQLNPGNMDIDIIDYGACHTKSDAVVHIKSQSIVFASDLLFIKGTPIAWAGPISRMIKALDRLLALNARIYVPGHGPITGKEGIMEAKAYFNLILAQGTPRLEKGMSLVEAALDMDLGPFRSWTDPERLIINLHCLEKEVRPETKEISPVKLFGLMEVFREKV